MPSHRCINVQGWEPTDGGSPDLVHIDLTAFADPHKKSAHAFTNRTTAMTTRSDSVPWANSTKRQAPLERTSTMPYSSTTTRPTVQRYPTSEASVMSSSSASRPLMSSRSAAAAGRAVRPRSSTERKIARKRAENANYIPRPRNSFIIFRTEFVLRKTGGGGASGKHANADSDEDEASGTLSKQASEVWHRMSDAEKQPWVERAEQEKRDHAAKYPNYRYRPVRQNSHRKSSSADRSSTASDAGAAPMLLDDILPSAAMDVMKISETEAQRINGPAASLQTIHDETLPNAYLQSGADLHCASISEASRGAMPELRMPAPISATFSPSTSSLANSLITPPVTPPEQHSSVTLPSVPRVPMLSLPSRSELHHDSTLFPMPRSPSAPTFLQAQIQPMLFGGTATANASSATSLSVPRGPGIRRVSCPPKPQFNNFDHSVEARMPAVVDSQMIVPSPLSVANLDTMGADYFPEFIQQQNNGATDEYFSLLAAQDLAGPTAHPTWQVESEFMMKNNDNCYTNLDINMSSLLPTVTEETEPPFSLPSGVTPEGHGPLEAVAALWSREVGGASDVPVSYESSVTSETSTENYSPMTTSFSSGASSNNDEPLSNFGLGMYNCALDDFFIGSPDSTARATQCGNALASDIDVLQLSRDLESELSCASVLPASTLSFSALCGF